MPENKTTIKIHESESQAEVQEKIRKEPDVDVKQKGLNENEDIGETGAGIETSDKIKALEQRVEELEKEVEANYDRFVRVTADFENYKKRTIREMDDLRKYANENFLKEMLSAVDNLQRAVDSGSKDESDKKKLLEGVEITLMDVLRIFEKYGVKEFESQGRPFDPAFHQAMMQEQTKKYPDNTVLSELQRGYTIHDRLLRPAMVVVGRNISDTGSECGKETNSDDGK